MMDDTTLTAIVSALGGSGAVSVAVKLMLRKLSKDWETMASSINKLVDEVHSIKVRLAVYESLASEQKKYSDEIKSMQRDIVVLQQQVAAAWKVLDKPRLSDVSR